MNISDRVIEYAERKDVKDVMEYALSSGVAVSQLGDGTNIWEFEDGSMLEITDKGPVAVKYAS